MVADAGRPKRMVHVAGDALLQNTGFSQQFSIEVNELKGKGHDISILAFCHIKVFRQKAAVGAFREKYQKNGIRVYVVPTFLTGKMFLGLLYFPVAWFVFLYLILWKGIRIFHFHEYFYADMFLFLKWFAPKGIRTFCDIHGVVIEENIYRGSLKSGSIRHRYHNYLEKMAIQRADGIFCVSRNMIQYYGTKHAVGLNQFSLTRSSFDPAIFGDFGADTKDLSKKTLGLEGRKIILYMGHKRAWQQTKEVLVFYDKVRKEIDGVFLLFLTDDYESINEECKRLGIQEDEYMVRYVPHEEVPLYSYAADAAILLRDDSIVNKVASPVKFSEYLASGAAVIISPSIGDLPEIVRTHNIGVVLSGEVGNAIGYLKELFRNERTQKAISGKCREVAENEFSARNTIDTFLDCYKGMTG